MIKKRDTALRVVLSSLKLLGLLILLFIVFIMIYFSFLISRYATIRYNLFLTRDPQPIDTSGNGGHLIPSTAEFVDNLKAGDILIFSKRNPSISSKIISGFCKTCFYHIGIVVNYNDVKCLLHFIDDRLRSNFFEPTFVCDDGFRGMSVSRIDVILP